jgi:hypothetical protein
VSDELDPREAERVRRRDREVRAAERELMRPGMGKVFKQIQDTQANVAKATAAKADAVKATRKRGAKRP